MNQTSTFYVKIRDSFDNPRAVNDVSSISIAFGGVAYASTFTYAGTDSYLVSFVPNRSGVLTLNVYVLGVQISGSPFHPVISP